MLPRVTAPAPGSRPAMYAPAVSVSTTPPIGVIVTWLCEAAFSSSGTSQIADTTDAALHPEFTWRRTEKVIDGVRQVGWFVEDLTLCELKTLRVIERLPQLRRQNAAMDGRFGLVT